MPGKSGRKFLIAVNTGTEAIPVWTVVGSQRDATIRENRNLPEANSKDSLDQDLLDGRYSVQVDFEALFVATDAAYAALQAAHRAGNTVQLMVSEDGGNVEHIKGRLESIERLFPDEEPAIVQVTFRSTGTWVAA